MDVETKSGHLAPTGLPTGMIIMGRGQEVTLDFPINNEDPDNDVDTITVTIPGAEVTGSSYEWYNSVVHEWTLDNTTDPDTVRYSAQDDFTGLEGNESVYYDVVGDNDDALDFVDPVSERITISVTFKAPDTTGFKTGQDAIQVTAENLKTEASGSVIEFPRYPFLVTDDGESFYIFILKTAGFNMDILYGNSKLFTPTRASDFLTSGNGFLYTEGDHKMAIVDKPTDDTRVVPLITADEGMTGPFELSWFEFTVTDVSADQVDSETLESAYTESIPEGIEELNLDLDGDGILNSNDPDIDGDGYDNEVDPDPYDDGVGNNPPTGLTPSSNAVDGRIKEGETLILSATAIDADELTYTWTNQQTGATHTGAEWTITGLEPGIYTFTVEVRDYINEPVNTTIGVEVEEEDGSIFPSFAIKLGTIAIIVLFIIVLSTVFILIIIFAIIKAKKNKPESEEIREEIKPKASEIEIPIQNETPMSPKGIPKTTKKTPLYQQPESIENDKERIPHFPLNQVRKPQLDSEITEKIKESKSSGTESATGTRKIGEPQVNKGVSFDGYRVQRRIGTGGFSDVYLAIDEKGKRSALKLPKLDEMEEVDPKISKKFNTEAKNWSKLLKYDGSSEGIVKVYSYGNEPKPYIAMEYMDRGNLKKNLHKMDYEMRLKCIKSILRTLYNVHHLGVIHRDIKPENILLNSKGEWKIADWGLSKVLLESSIDHTKGDSIKATISYAAPEQIDSSKFGRVDWRTDIYQMGVLAYEMLSGSKPYRGTTSSVLYSIINDEPTDPMSLNRSIDRKTADAIIKAMRKDKKKRWQDSIEFLNALS